MTTSAFAIPVWYLHIASWCDQALYKHRLGLSYQPLQMYSWTHTLAHTHNVTSYKYAMNHSWRSYNKSQKSGLLDDLQLARSLAASESKICIKDRFKGVPGRRIYRATWRMVDDDGRLSLCYLLLPR